MGANFIHFGRTATSLYLFAHYWQQPEATRRCPIPEPTFFQPDPPPQPFTLMLLEINTRTQFLKNRVDKTLSVQTVDRSVSGAFAVGAGNAAKPSVDAAG